MKKTVSKVMIFVVMFSFFTGQNLFAMEISKDRTAVSGVGAKITATYQKPLSKDVTITPSTGGRTVRLQMYSSKTKKYRTIKVYKTKDTNSSTVKITFPKENRRRRTGKWRIVVDGNKHAEKVVKNIMLTTINIVNK